MQDNGQIARAFAAWQRAHEQLCDGEARLAAATDGWRQGTHPRPDALYNEVVRLKAEQDWRYGAAADALRNRRDTGPAPLAAASVSAVSGPGGSSPLAAA